MHRCNASRTFNENFISPRQEQHKTKQTPKTHTHKQNNYTMQTIKKKKIYIGSLCSNKTKASKNTNIGVSKCQLAIMSLH